LSGLVAIGPAYEANKLEAPKAVIGLLVAFVISKVAASILFLAVPGRRMDRVFLLFFGIMSVVDVDRYLSAPFPSFLITPAVFVAGAATIFADRRRVRDR